MKAAIARANGEGGLHLRLAFATAVALAAIVAAQCLLLGWRDPSQIGRLALLYGVSALVGTGAGSWLAALLPFHGARRAAAWIVLAGGGTMGLGALLFALHYRAAYAQWHADALTVPWTFQAVFTMAGAGYFWAVLGTRMILPLALLPLLAGALAFARGSR